MSSPIIVAGFHRSGTSLAAQMFDMAGMQLPNYLKGDNPVENVDAKETDSEDTDSNEE